MSKFVGRKVVIRGVKYGSLAEAAEAAGLTYPTFTGRLTNGWSLTRAFSTPPARGKKITIKGVTYASYEEASQAAGLHERLLASRLQAGWSLERAFTTPTLKQAFTFQGVVYPNKTACAKALGIPRDRFFNRLYRGFKETDVLAPRYAHRPTKTLKVPKLPWTQRLAWLSENVTKRDDCWLLKGYRVAGVRIWALAGAGWAASLAGVKGLYDCGCECVNPAHARIPRDTRPARGIPVGKENACRATLENRLMETPTGHWSWTGRHDQELPRTRLPGMGEMTVPVAMWLTYRGPLPKWSHVRAICDKSWCVNPEHLGRVIREAK